MKAIKVQPETVEGLTAELFGLGAMIVGGGIIDRHGPDARMTATFTDGRRLVMTGIDTMDALRGLIDQRRAELNANDGEGMELDAE